VGRRGKKPLVRGKSARLFPWGENEGPQNQRENFQETFSKGIRVIMQRGKVSFFEKWKKKYDLKGGGVVVVGGVGMLFVPRFPTQGDG